MTKPTAADWDRLASLNRHNTIELAAIKAEEAAGRRVKKGRVLRLRDRVREASRLEKELKKRAGIQ